MTRRARGGDENAWKDLTAATIEADSFNHVIVPVERDLVADINGDGLAGAPPCVAGSFDTETVGVTNPPDTTVFAYFWHTPVPYFEYWIDQGVPGGCDFDHHKAEANIGISTWYVFATSNDGCISLCASPPSLVSSRRPSLSWSRRPTWNTRVAMFGT